MIFLKFSSLPDRQTNNTNRPGTSEVPGPFNVGYNPVKFGARLALKASTPSLKSADWRKRL
jgi:hypothetical protein